MLLKHEFDNFDAGLRRAYPEQVAEWEEMVKAFEANPHDPETNPYIIHNEGERATRLFVERVLTTRV